MPKTMRVAAKSYVLRRARATFELQRLDLKPSFFIAGPLKKSENCSSQKQVFDKAINTTADDFQRTVEQPKLQL